MQIIKKVMYYAAVVCALYSSPMYPQVFQSLTETSIALSSNIEDSAKTAAINGIEVATIATPTIKNAYFNLGWTADQEFWLLCGMQYLMWTIAWYFKVAHDELAES